MALLTDCTLRVSTLRLSDSDMICVSGDEMYETAKGTEDIRHDKLSFRERAWTGRENSRPL